MIEGCVNDIEGCQRISGVVSRKLLTNIRSHTIVFLYYLMAVLTAIAIPVFTSQLEKSREATDMSNLRAAYAEITANYLANGAVTADAGSNATKAEVKLRQTQSGWQNTENGKLYTRVNGQEGSLQIPDTAVGSGKTVTLSISAGTGEVSLAS